MTDKAPGDIYLADQRMSARAAIIMIISRSLLIYASTNDVSDYSVNVGMYPMTFASLASKLNDQ
jgi:major membrane immunogen (membrane-anchored lipoprotein)